MEFAPAISKLPIHHQAAFSALNCEKLLPSIAKFGEYEVTPISNLFEKITAAIYSYSIGQPAATAAYS